MPTTPRRVLRPCAYRSAGGLAGVRARRLRRQGADLVPPQRLGSHGRAAWLPAVNLKFIFDGEEEIGSPYFGPLTEKHRDLLAADLVIVTDGPKHASGRPTISCGARGVLKFEMAIESARRDLHSGNFAAPNPAWRLTGLLSTWPRPTARRSSKASRTAWSADPGGARDDGGALRSTSTGSSASWASACPPDYLERIMFHPTLTIRGLRAGSSARRPTPSSRTRRPSPSTSAW